MSTPNRAESSTVNSQRANLIVEWWFGGERLRSQSGGRAEIGSDLWELFQKFIICIPVKLKSHSGQDTQGIVVPHILVLHT